MPVILYSRTTFTNGIYFKAWNFSNAFFVYFQPLRLLRYKHRFSSGVIFFDGDNLLQILKGQACWQQLR